MYGFSIILTVNRDYISLNSINQLIFVMLKCGVLFEVRTEFLNIIYTSFGFKGISKGIPLSPCRRQRGEEYSSYSLFTSTLEEGELSVSPPGRALPPRKDPRYPFKRRLGGPQGWSKHRV
jgi:hypothetical protein